MRDPKLTIPPFLQAEIDAAALTIVRVRWNSELFNDVLKVSSAAYGRTIGDVSYAVDEYSEIYAARFNDEIVGTISVTRASVGAIVFEERYPKAMLESFRPILCSAYRLCVTQRFSKDTRISRILMMSCWADELARGMRLAAIHVNTRMVPFYLRFGYLKVKGGDFVNPRYGTPSQVMVCPADHEHPSVFRQLSRSVPDELSLFRLREYVEPTS